MQKLILFFILIVMSLAACHQESEPEQVLPDFPWECDYDIGTYEILPSSYLAIPYEGKDMVVFRDSTGTELKFTFIEIYNLHAESSILKHNPLDESDDIYFCYYGDTKTYQGYNDSLKISISARLYARPYYNEPLKEYVADQLSITIIAGTSPLSFFSGFSKTIDQRTSPDATINSVDQVYTCFGKTFYNAEHQSSIFSQPTVYYTKTEGVVSFKEMSGKKWCFERFE